MSRPPGIRRVGEARSIITEEIKVKEEQENVAEENNQDEEPVDKMLAMLAEISRRMDENTAKSQWKSRLLSGILKEGENWLEKSQRVLRKYEEEQRLLEDENSEWEVKMKQNTKEMICFHLLEK